MTQNPSNDGLSGKFQQMLLGKHQALAFDMENIKLTSADSVKSRGLTFNKDPTFDKIQGLRQLALQQLREREKIYIVNQETN